jgi:hypothetical protein
MGSTIGSVTDLVATIQAQLGARSPTARTATARPGAKAAPRERYAPDQLATLIETRVRQIDRDDPKRGRKAFRVFVEAVLLSHLGDGLVNDPRFHQLVDEVQGALETDPGCALMVDQAMAYLLSGESGAAAPKP